MASERRWLPFGLAASLLLNVFLVGLVGGDVLGGRGGLFGHKAGPGPLIPRSNVRALPDDERKRFEDAMAPHRADIRAARQDQQKLRRAAEADIAAPTFDRAKVAADFSALREHLTSVQEKTQAGLLDALQALTPASRAALVQHEKADARP